MAKNADSRASCPVQSQCNYPGHVNSPLRASVSTSGNRDDRSRDLTDRGAIMVNTQSCSCRSEQHLRRVLQKGLALLVSLPCSSRHLGSPSQPKENRGPQSTYEEGGGRWEGGGRTCPSSTAPSPVSGPQGATPAHLPEQSRAERPSTFHCSAPGRREKGGFLPGQRYPGLHLCCLRWDDPERGRARITTPGPHGDTDSHPLLSPCLGAIPDTVPAGWRQRCLRCMRGDLGQ